MSDAKNNVIDDTVKVYFNSLTDYDPLTKDEEHDLIRKYKHNNDLDARNKVIQSNLKYAVKLASAYRGRGIPYSELISEANSGLIESIDKFDLSKDVKLMSYSKWWIMQRMQNSIEKYNKLPKAELSSDREFEYEADDDGVVHKIINTNDNLMSDEDIENEKNDKALFLNTICDVLTDREKDMVNMYYGVGYGSECTLEDIAEKYSLTKERIRQIIETAFRKLRSEALVTETKYVK